MNPAQAEPQLSEATVIRLVLDGNAGAFCELARPYQRGLYRKALSIVGSEAEAEEVAQNAVLKAFDKLAPVSTRCTVPDLAHQHDDQRSPDVVKKQSQTSIRISRLRRWQRWKSLQRVCGFARKSFPTFGKKSPSQITDQTAPPGEYATRPQFVLVSQLLRMK
jgi:hypothetical protein